MGVEVGLHTAEEAERLRLQIAVDIPKVLNGLDNVVLFGLSVCSGHAERARFREQFPLNHAIGKRRSAANIGQHGVSLRVELFQVRASAIGVGADLRAAK